MKTFYLGYVPINNVTFENFEKSSVTEIDCLVRIQNSNELIDNTCYSMS